MMQITDQKKCTGCGACRLLCPKGCIETGSDGEGFGIPQIDIEKCTNCGLCAARCPENNNEAFKRNNHIKVLGARYKNDEVLSKSASGGVFAGIAAKVLETPGNAVFGCAFDENLVARHICVTDIKDIELCQSSKYVQSDVCDTYLQAKGFLDEGKTVFYTGCPCQIAGLYAFLGKDYNNLLTADLICHGVPSPLLFKKYLSWLGNKLGGKIVEYNFRGKIKGAEGHRIKARTHAKSKIISPDTDPYYIGFIYRRVQRECCYTCPYASRQRVADITLGDFWGVEYFNPEFYDSRGVSVAVVNTTKGEEIFKKVYGEFHMLESCFDNAAKGNINLCKPLPRPALRDIAYRNFLSGEAFKISTRAFVKILIKRITPTFVLRAYKLIKRRIKQK